MNNLSIDPMQRYEYLDLIDKQKRVNKSNTNEEFLNMVIEQIFLSKILTTSSHINDNTDSEEPEDVVTFQKNGIMDDYFKQNVISQLTESDSFGLLDALKKRGFSNDVK
ncbi:MAG: hypothetical protein DKM50_04530 [Candidatus Margulisiibacteriota bacterium]|nr:MAG: hypothetical protein A2X43_05670 [Candidatus Margulisbacteria bacterium GWD2_39_127]PZM82017.1 MAG: hypothetical protein DKM50_04530 [Candidatus Margulisiibacteriota bacterium]HCY35862.1 hypothetical protein [Candidatus Margulisiibacteriota bacterium]